MPLLKNVGLRKFTIAPGVEIPPGRSVNVESKLSEHLLRAYSQELVLEELEVPSEKSDELVAPAPEAKKRKK